MFRARFAIAATATLLAGLAQAAPLGCYEDADTLRHTCFEPAAVRQNGDLRSSPVYMGGPKGARSVGLTLVTNCKTGISTAQDRQGRNVAGNQNGATDALAHLSRWMCEVKRPRTDKTLRQF